MKIHTSHRITHHVLLDAVNHATDTAKHGAVVLDRSTSVGSRSHDRAYDVRLIGDGSVNRRRVNAGTADVDRFDLDFSATYDSWGHFFGYLYAVDPKIMCGNKAYPAYANADDFHAKTEGKYRLAPELVSHVIGTFDPATGRVAITA